MNNAERIYSELKSENANIWYIADKFGSKVMIKAPEISLKAILRGCRLSFIFGGDDITETIFFHAGIKIYDDVQQPLIVTGILRYRDEHSSLETILKNKSTPLQLFNELDVCVATGKITIKKEEAQRILSLLGEIDSLYSGEFKQSTIASLDRFDESINKAHDGNSTLIIHVDEINPNISDWVTMNNHFCGEREHYQINIDSADEGFILEGQIWYSLDSAFGNHLYKGPQINKNGKQRELTDVLAYYELGLFLIESKTAAVFSAQENKSVEKKIASIQKQIIKGINQVVGACKALKDNYTVYDSRGLALELNRKTIPHCIVLVSEILHSGDWTNIDKRMIDAAKKNNIFLHVMDLAEFILILKASSGKKEVFDYNLMKRFEQWVQHKTIHMRSRVRTDSN
ncbi:MAG: hypothetical protein WD425_07885 [Nitrospirales bacterium]